jgi:hypothetical protein
MKKMLGVFLLGVVAAGAFFGAWTYHFIVTGDGLVVERKVHWGLEDTYVDTRGWGILDYGKHPNISAIVASRKIRVALGAGSDAEKVAKDALDEAKKALEKIGK